MRQGLMFVLLIVFGQGFSGEDETEDLFSKSLEELLDLEVEAIEEDAKGLSLYGFVAPVNAEQVYSVPGRDAEGNTVKASEGFSYGDPEGHFYLRAWYGPFEGVVDIFASSEDARLEAASLSYSIGKQHKVTAGKMFRKFDLYNETLNHFIVFTGIEAPELFDSDHTIPRFANLAYRWKQGPWQLYLDTGEPESGPEKDIVPFGWDLRHETRSLTVGTSGYLSNLGEDGTPPSVAPGEGSPEGAVLPWMDEDRYSVIGAFARKQQGSLLLEAAYWHASHSGTRNPNAVLTTARNAYLNPRQRQNFFGDAAGLSNDALGPEDVITDADFSVDSAYLRVGYAWSEFTTYVHWDWLDHPETIADKDWGGDNEAGLADDGAFTKWSVGGIWRPNRNIALKLDSSLHVQDFNGQTESYPEIRIQGAWAFKYQPEL